MIEERNNDYNETIRNVAKVNARLADALYTNGLSDNIADYGETPPTPCPAMSLCYVAIGENHPHARNLTIIQTAADGWIVTIPAPGMGTLVLGRYENAYGAVGDVRQTHLATNVIDGAQPSYPAAVLAEIDDKLADAIADADILDAVVDVNHRDDTVIFGNGHPFSTIWVTRTESAWNVGYDSPHDIGLIRGDTDLSEVIDFLDGYYGGDD